MENIDGEVCDSNRLGLLGGLMLFCCLCTSLLVCAGREGCLLGIGETALEGVPDDIDEDSSRDMFVEEISLTDVPSLSSEIKRRFRGRNVAGDSAFMAAEALSR